MKISVGITVIKIDFQEDVVRSVEGFGYSTVVIVSAAEIGGCTEDVWNVWNAQEQKEFFDEYFWGYYE